MPLKENKDPNGDPKTLHVVNLIESVTEDLIVAMFSQVGHVKSCQLIREPGYDHYCFVEFENNSEAKEALTIMNQQTLNGREIKVCWASDRPKLESSHHHCIFVGSLSPEIDTDQLRNAFSAFGEICDCYVARDPVKSFGFCSFVKNWAHTLALSSPFMTGRPKNCAYVCTCSSCHTRVRAVSPMFSVTAPERC